MATSPPAPGTRSTGSIQTGGKVHAFETPSGFLERPQRPSGQKLPPLVQKKMERFFDTDFSAVRVHVGPEAMEIGALAFTIGTDIYFSPGQYEPHTPRGQQLLGHELTHVLQQREGRVSNPLGEGVAVVQDLELEAEAERMGQAVAAQLKSQALEPKGLPPRKLERPRHPAAPGSPALQARSGYRLLIGTYLHENGERLPDPLAGHTFVALEQPGQPVQAWGFSPADFSRDQPFRDLNLLRRGVAGVVHDDTGALAKPGVRMRAYPINAVQAQAAMAKIAEYQSGRYQFHLDRRQCSTFALDVLRAAEVPDLPGAPVRRPRDLYHQLGSPSKAT
ncbi:MAG TPA: DUF4157 domain-containing protein [Polyangia bacterium]|jgi:hypothetical protein|nr:DUF4157 domain-containing protein [Polyangia bacterium]